MQTRAQLFESWLMLKSNVSILNFTLQACYSSKLVKEESRNENGLRQESSCVSFKIESNVDC